MKLWPVVDRLGSSTLSSVSTPLMEKLKDMPLRAELPPHIAIGTNFETAWMRKEEIDQVRDAWKAASLDGAKRVVS